MTPKEKAQELDSRFYELVADTPDPEWRAKQAALISVNEIIEALKDNAANSARASTPPSGFLIKSWLYYEEVKQEIKNL